MGCVIMKNDQENKIILREAKKIVTALGKMFAPFCEIILHDLTTPDHTIISIENNQSGRQIGDPATEIGYARINNFDFPEILQNYANFFPDGRPAKSTSIGLKNSEGQFIAAICLNLDLSPFLDSKKYIEEIITLDSDSPIKENLQAISINGMRKIIKNTTVGTNIDPRSLRSADKQSIIKELYIQGYMRLKNAIPVASECLGISRATVYNYLRLIKNNQKL